MILITSIREEAPLKIQQQVNFHFEIDLDASQFMVLKNRATGKTNQVESIENFMNVLAEATIWDDKAHVKDKLSKEFNDLENGQISQLLAGL